MKMVLCINLPVYPQYGVFCSEINRSLYTADIDCPYIGGYIQYVYIYIAQ